MNIYRMNRLKLIILVVIYIVILGYFLRTFDLFRYIRVIIFGIVPGILVFRKLFTYKIYINSNNFVLEWIYFFKKNNIIFEWKEILKIEYKYQRVYLYKNNKKLIINKEWINYSQIWIQVYEEINKNNKTCILDETFLNKINELKKTYNFKDMT